MGLAPTPGRVSSAGADEHSIVFQIDGADFTLYPNLVDSAGARAVREQTGMSYRKVLANLEDDPDIDLVAVLVWVARCQAGEKINFDEVAAGIDYTSKIDVQTAEQPVGDDHPLS